jgi:O-antigen/teichoic acid export membrane protein
VVDFATGENPGEEQGGVGVPVETKGMGGRVARGGAWTAGGQAATFAASLVTTPFVTAMLGKEGYGVWSLILRVIGSLAFADAGMGVASTKYVTEAHARGDADGERRAMWTSFLIAFVPTMVCALVVLAAAPWIVATFFAKIPDNLRGPAILGLQVAAFGFVIRTVANVFNSPLVARLRLDLNALILYGGGVAQVLLTPVAIYYGGIALGAGVMALTSLLMAGAQMLLCARFVPGSLIPAIDRALLPPMLRFGAGAFVLSIAAQVLFSADALIVGSMISAEAAGYYNIAFQAANVLMIVPGALSSALLPAFNRLLTTHSLDELQDLISGVMRALCFALPPLLALMYVVARPFFTAWVGADIARNATPVFFCLTAGLAINVLMFVPSVMMMALGRTGLAAKVALYEIVPYVAYTTALTWSAGIMGAAAGRGVRIVIACCILFPIASRLSAMQFRPRIERPAFFALALCGAVLPIAFAVWPRLPLWATIAASVMGLAFYAVVMHARVLSLEERAALAALPAQIKSKFGRRPTS